MFEPGTSSAPPESDDIARPATWLSPIFPLFGALAFSTALALCIRCYFPCPFWDEWAFVNPIAQGAGLSSWKWLWSQHNEHRLLMTRLLILLDLHTFGGKNISLFVEMFSIQVLQWVALYLALERLTNFPLYLKRTVAGIFAFCLFHLNQAENLTWAFQVSFVLAFALGTIALLTIAFFDRWKHKLAAAIAVGLIPFVAAVNVAGGLLIGPVAIAFALFQKLSIRYVAVMTALFATGALLYLAGYHVPPSSLTPWQAILHPKDLFVYLLTYFGASWTRLFPHKERLICFVSFLVLTALTLALVRRRDRTSAFEWFCVAECVLLIITATLTGLGRLQYGVGQAYAGRYQTPAMLYWGSLCALFLIYVWKEHEQRFLAAEAFVLLIVTAFAVTLLPIWHATTAHSDVLAQACLTVLHGNADDSAARLMYGGTRQDVAPGVAYLHRLWNK